MLQKQGRVAVWNIGQKGLRHCGHVELRYPWDVKQRCRDTEHTSGRLSKEKMLERRAVSLQAAADTM